MAAFFVLGVIDMLVAIVVGVAIFRVPLRGDLLFLAGANGVFLIGALCWGILISAVVRSQLLAYQLGALTSFLPAFLLSGFIFDIENMPRVIQIVTYIFPARYFVTVLKGDSCAASARGSFGWRRRCCLPMPPSCFSWPLGNSNRRLPDACVGKNPADHS